MKPCANCGVETDEDDLCPEEDYCLDCHAAAFSPSCEEAIRQDREDNIIEDDYDPEAEDDE